MYLAKKCLIKYAVYLYFTLHTLKIQKSEYLFNIFFKKGTKFEQEYHFNHKTIVINFIMNFNLTSLILYSKKLHDYVKVSKMKTKLPTTTKCGKKRWIQMKCVHIFKSCV